MNSTSSSSSSFRHIREKQQLSRVLYGNPVCLLTTAKRPIFGYHHANAMTISWLTPVDNQGNIFLSINTKRHTAERLMKEFSMGENDPSIGASEKDAKTYFVLNIPTVGQEAMVLQIGGCSGRDVDKFADDDPLPAKNGITEERVDVNEEKDKDQLPLKSFTLCRPGWTSYGDIEENDDSTVASSLSQPLLPPTVAIESANSHSVRGRQKAGKTKKSSTEVYGDYDGVELVAIRECIAHIVCSITRMSQHPPGAITTPQPVKCDSSNPRLPGGGSGGASHYHVLARMEHAFVQEAYWDTTYSVLRPTTRSLPAASSKPIGPSSSDCSNKRGPSNSMLLPQTPTHADDDFSPPSSSLHTPPLPPLLSFLGCKQFAHQTQPPTNTN